jgi:hypothetical protein
VAEVLSKRYHAFLCLDEPQALHTLHLAARTGEEVAEIDPSGV